LDLKSTITLDKMEYNLINFIEEVERGRIAFLDSKNKSQCNERFLPSTKLVHVFHFSILTTERY